MSEVSLPGVHDQPTLNCGKGKSNQKSLSIPLLGDGFPPWLLKLTFRGILLILAERENGLEFHWAGAGPPSAAGP
jgi:hypothetical protein